MGFRFRWNTWVPTVLFLLVSCGRSDPPTERARLDTSARVQIDPRVRVVVRFPKLEGKSPQFFSELASSPQARSVGLMFRTSLPQDHGMLFLFEELSPHSFYMKNTYVPLDIIFMDTRGPTATVVGVLEHMRALDETSKSLSEPSLSALEVNAGLARKLGIKKGSLVEIRPYKH